MTGIKMARLTGFEPVAYGLEVRMAAFSIFRYVPVPPTK